MHAIRLNFRRAAWQAREKTRGVFLLKRQRKCEASRRENRKQKETWSAHRSPGEGGAGTSILSHVLCITQLLYDPAFVRPRSSSSVDSVRQWFSRDRPILPRVRR